MRPEVGGRAFAVASSSGGKAQVFGPGTYVGTRPVPGERAWYEGMENVCIELDTGEVVFGHECWWGEHDSVLARFEGVEMEFITVDDYYADPT